MNGNLFRHPLGKIYRPQAHHIQLKPVGNARVVHKLGKMRVLDARLAKRVHGAKQRFAPLLAANRACIHAFEETRHDFVEKHLARRNVTVHRHGRNAQLRAKRPPSASMMAYAAAMTSALVSVPRFLFCSAIYSPPLRYHPYGTVVYLQRIDIKSRRS